MTNKERWQGWYLVQVGAQQFLGRLTEDQDNAGLGDEVELRFFVLRPCVKIIEQYPVIPDPKGQPVIMPVMSFVTIGMFQTDNVRQCCWADTWVDLGGCEEQQLQRYSDGYDAMIRQTLDNIEKERRRNSTIELPNPKDVSKLGIKL